MGFFQKVGNWLETGRFSEPKDSSPQATCPDFSELTANIIGLPMDKIEPNTPSPVVSFVPDSSADPVLFSHGVVDPADRKKQNKARQYGEELRAKKEQYDALLEEENPGKRAALGARPSSVAGVYVEERVDPAGKPARGLSEELYKAHRHALANSLTKIVQGNKR